MVLRRELSDWPGAVESVWPMLEEDSLCELRDGVPPDSHALRVSSGLLDGELAGSAFVRNARILLRAAAEEGEGLRVTASGTLSLASVARMRAETAWPDMEAQDHFRDGTRYREQDIWEVRLLRAMVQDAGLVKPGTRALEPTVLGRRMLEPGSLGALQALLFQALFWRTDLSLSMGWLVRRALGRWPQHDIGPILWALSGVAGEWHGADTLVVSCTDPQTPAPHGLTGWPAPLFASRVLFPLCWFGVMEWREIQDMHDVRRWRKTALFDRMLSFDVRLADGRPGGH